MAPLTKQKLALIKAGFVRQNWTPVNLYNLYRMKEQSLMSCTYFQQKYTAKKMTRVYHGEHITKRQWNNIFKHSLKSVVPMSTRQLAASAGAEHGAGRGSGLDLRPAEGALEGARKIVDSPKVPYMYQTFAPMERRLDMAVFRAMFASSALQARQWVVHGFVKVNGQKTPYPNYMLNPGDMFSVELDQVLIACGAPKRGKAARKALSKKWNAKKAAEAAAAEGEEGKTEAGEQTAVEGAVAKQAGDAAGEEAKAAAEEKDASAKDAEGAEKEKKTMDPLPPSTPPWLRDPNNQDYIDEKPYRTPWVPRDYLSAFAFIPKYLEVDHKTGHAVYLRDPVAGPGYSEVPTPFHEDTMQLAFNWFLRRR